jgi:hypothetical protein
MRGQQHYMYCINGLKQASMMCVHAAAPPLWKTEHRAIDEKCYQQLPFLKAYAALSSLERCSQQPHCCCCCTACYCADSLSKHVEVYAVAHLMYQHPLPGVRLGKGQPRRRHHTALPVDGGKCIAGPAAEAAAAAGWQQQQ